MPAVRKAVGAVALAALLLGAGSLSLAEESPQVSCALTPRVLDVSRAPGPLTARLEFRSADGLSPLDPHGLQGGVYITSVGGTVLPEPSAEAEGIGEDPAARRVEDATDVWQHLRSPNGLREAVVLFHRPSDGDPATPHDGNAGDVLAMLLGVPDGESAEICLAGRLGEAAFQCCDTVQVRNRGLRDLPRGLMPGGEKP
jgi:hypothetical protein